jgi:hypothetical protein
MGKWAEEYGTVQSEVRRYSFILYYREPEFRSYSNALFKVATWGLAWPRISLLADWRAQSQKREVVRRFWLRRILSIWCRGSRPSLFNGLYQSHKFINQDWEMYDLRFSRRWLWRMPPSGMWCHVALITTDVSEESIAIISVKESAT